jgi:hypothetical protein
MPAHRKGNGRPAGTSRVSEFLPKIIAFPRVIGIVKGSIGDAYMLPKKPQPESTNMDRIIADARRDRLARETTYRERALKLFPWICGRCGREFSGRKLRELTVHHKDHNHDNNPPDGSNWELLCIYCHDMEHQKYLDEEVYGDSGTGADDHGTSSTYKPFACLATLLKDKK